MKTLKTRVENRRSKKKKRCQGWSRPTRRVKCRPTARPRNKTTNRPRRREKVLCRAVAILI